MKIKSIAAICKKNKNIAIFERYSDDGDILTQYIGDGSAVYPVVRVFADEKPETDDTPEEKRLFTETPMQCPFCEGENSNARVYEDKQNKEYFVYCQKCGIETKDTFTSKAKAVKAFTEGKTKKVTGREVADE